MTCKWMKEMDDERKMT